MNGHRSVLIAFVAFIAAPVYGLDDADIHAWAIAQVTSVEHVAPGTDLVAPVFLVKEDPVAGRLVAVSAALGSPTRHGIRYTWCFQTQKDKTKILFKKLPFEATEWIPTPDPEMKGLYWIYNCFLCDTPESGFVYKVPVVAKKHKRDFALTADTTAPDYPTIRKEALRQFNEIEARYKNPHPLPELRKMRREVKALFATP